MGIKHEHIQCVLLAWSGEVGQAHVANEIAEEYLRLGGARLKLVAGETWNNQQKILHRWLPGTTAQQRDKIRQLEPAILNVLPRRYRHRLSIFDTIERRALLSAESAVCTAIEAHDAAVRSVYQKSQRDVESPQYH